MLKIARTIVQNVTVSNLTRHSAGPATRHYTSSAEDPDAPIDMPNPYAKDQRQCILCKHQITPDYRNIKLLSQFQSPYTGRIYGRHITGLCKQRQQQVEEAIRRAQNCALMPTYHKHLDFLNDPKLFDPERPVRPHKY